MLGKFVYSNPTKLYFGENSLRKSAAGIGMLW